MYSKRLESKEVKETAKHIFAWINRDTQENYHNRLADFIVEYEDALIDDGYEIT